MSYSADLGLTIVPAGAGAGKTHRIKTALSEWVRDGKVRPERILAVTFSETGASELRERIRSGLIAEGLLTEALAVERAYVSTFHRLGLRLLTEHAFALGASPQPRLLGDAERDLLIRQSLAYASALDPIKAVPEQFGYAGNPRTGITVESALRGKVLDMIDLLRGLGDKGANSALIEPALDRITLIYGPTIDNPTLAAQTLTDAVRAMLSRFPHGVAETVTVQTARSDLENDHGAFLTVGHDPVRLERDWALWQRLRRLRLSNRSTHLPEGYDELASAIILAADVLPRHPGPLADARLHLKCLIACAQEVMELYEARKRALSVIDFADMIIGADRLLRTDPAVCQAVLNEIDCVIIDEFQDTNPVQFQLLWQLGAKAPRTLLVGDVKQSIMGFQGADPRLSEALASAHPKALDPLDRNWRSTPAVMKFVNALGLGLFGTGYNSLTPTRAPVDGSALEVLHVLHSRGAKKYSTPPEHIAERIAVLLSAGEKVTDRATGAVRPARPSDVALLVGRHSTASRYADELRLRGVPVRISEKGWSTSPVVRAAQNALAFAANPRDIHAGLLLRTLGPDPLNLQYALSQQIDGEFVNDPVLNRLATLSDTLASMPVSSALDLVLEVAGLRTWAERMPDADQVRADLLRLEAESEAFERAHRDLKAASGFHGETIKVFLGWLAAREDERDFNRHPDPSADTAEAVEILTWHASKGREWPITVVAEFDRAIAEWPGTTSVNFEALDRIDDFEAALASAQLVHTPSLVAPEAQTRFIEDRRPAFEANARNLLYVALTRARDKLILEWPDFLKPRSTENPEPDCLFHVLAGCCDLSFGDAELKIGTTICEARRIHLPEITPCTVLAGASEEQSFWRFGPATPLAPIAVTPWRLQPSRTSHAVNVASRTISLGDPWNMATSSAERGTALHLALRTFMTRPDLAMKLPSATGLDADTLNQVQVRAAELRQWLVGQGFPTLHCEFPIKGQTTDGAEIPGTIDLLAVGPKGCLLIDHKSGGLPDGVGPYWAQLSAYSGLISNQFPQWPLLGVAIHWMDHGSLEMVNLQAA